MAEATPQTALESPPIPDLPGQTGMFNADAHLEQTAADISKATGGPTVSKPASKPPADSPDWRREPLDNFQCDQAGNVKVRGDGSPVRRGGKPRQPRPGDQLADGSVHGGEQAAAGGGSSDSGGHGLVIDPPAAPEAEAPAPDQGKVKFGPKAGAVLADGVFNVAEGLGGERCKPTEAEREEIREAAGEMLGGMQVAPWIGLAVLLGAYLIRVWIQNSKKGPGNGPGNGNGPRVEAPGDSGEQRQRENHARKGPLYRYA